LKQYKPFVLLRNEATNECQWDINLCIRVASRSPRLGSLIVLDTKTHGWSQQQPWNASQLKTRVSREEEVADHEAELALICPFISLFTLKVW